MNRIEINQFLMSRLSGFLNFRENFIDERMVSEITKLNLSEEEAFRMLLAGAMGLDLSDNPEHFRIFRSDFPRMARLIDNDFYASDPYFQLIPLKKAKSGNISLTQEAYQPYEAFVCGDIRQFPDGAVLAQIGAFRKPFPYPAIKENGRIWMTVTPNEIETIRPAAQSAYGRVLTLGLGLGYFALLTSENENVESVTAVEISDDVVRLFETHILPHFPNRQKIRILHADAFQTAEKLYASGEYDFCFSDLWHDAGDGCAMYQRLKSLEPLNPDMRFEYWIEDTMKWYL